MVRIKHRLLTALMTFLLGVAVSALFLLNGRDEPRAPDDARALQGSQGLRLIIPDDRWGPRYLQSIDEHAKKVNLPSLRSVVLPQEDFEIRFWYHGIPDFLDGVILRRSGGQWSAEHLYGRDGPQHFRVAKEKLAAPQSGWEATWDKLAGAGILSLPDASEVQCHSGALDGYSNVVEINMNRTYRTYRYDNPQLGRCAEAERVVAISEVMIDEFGLWKSPK